MSDYTVRSIDDLHTVHGVVRLAGAELGVGAFGLQVLDLPGGFTGYPEHDHAADGQEEVYVLLQGDLELLVDGERTAVCVGQLARVGCDSRRKLIPGPDGARVLAIGCAGRAAYVRPPDFQLSAEA